MQTYDKLWKGIIEDLFEEFLEMFFPDLIEKIDFSKGFEFLDQELSLLFPESVGKNRAVDKLVKVYLKDGTEEWILVHLEVQGYPDQTFERRMFTSFYRVFDRFDKEITALAIFTDKQKDYQPNAYVRDFHGTKLRYEYRTYKVLDQDKGDLLASNNPFALVILATLVAIEKKNAKDDELMNIKWYLARLLFERNYEKKTIISVFEFINFYIRFENKKNYGIFAKEISSTFQNQRFNMGIVDILVEDARLEGREEGREEGIEKGIEKGRDEGLYIKTHQVVVTIISKFPNWDNETVADLAQTSVELVKEIRAELGK
jgi:predicted transposase YdaD